MPNEVEPTAVARRAPARGGERFRLEVVEGPDRGARVTVEPSRPDRLLVGTSEACALRLADPTVSRRHAALWVEQAELRVTDLRSTNGCFVNGVRVFEAALAGGEALQFGDTRLLVARAPDAAPAPPAPGEAPADRLGPLVGASPQMRRLYPLLRRLAASPLPLVIEGETGTGKEVAAEALHELGPRAAGPFVVFDCTAVAPTLVEAALFGHERGAFTGATSARRGVFEEAQGGTLLVDEIGDLDLPLQAKLLRAVQRSEVRRIGGDRWLRVDVRVLAATRRDLDREVQAGRFREDLFYRLNVARVELPPLREREGDVALLARLFWDRFGGEGRPIPYDLFQSWEDYAWPGNVRELENAVARRLALGELAAEFDRPPAAAPPDAGGEGLTFRVDVGQPLAVAREALVARFERAYLARALAAHGHHAAAAAASAGIGKRYFNMLRARHGL